MAHPENFIQKKSSGPRKGPWVNHCYFLLILTRRAQSERVNQVIQAGAWLYQLVGGHQQPLKGSLKHPKKVTIAELPGTCLLCVYLFSFLFSRRLFTKVWNGNVKSRKWWRNHLRFQTRYEWRGCGITPYASPKQGREGWVEAMGFQFHLNTTRVTNMMPFYPAFSENLSKQPPRSRGPKQRIWM